MVYYSLVGAWHFPLRSPESTRGLFDCGSPVEGISGAWTDVYGVGSSVFTEKTISGFGDTIGAKDFNGWSGLSCGDVTKLTIDIDCQLFVGMTLRRSCVYGALGNTKLCENGGVLNTVDPVGGMEIVGQVFDALPQRVITFIFIGVGATTLVMGLEDVGRKLECFDELIMIVAMAIRHFGEPSEEKNSGCVVVNMSMSSLDGCRTGIMERIGKEILLQLMQFLESYLLEEFVALSSLLGLYYVGSFREEKGLRNGGILSVPGNEDQGTATFEGIKVMKVDRFSHEWLLRKSWRCGFGFLLMMSSRLSTVSVGMLVKWMGHFDQVYAVKRETAKSEHLQTILNGFSHLRLIVR